MTKLTELQLDEHNANQGTDRGKQMLKDSLLELKAGRSILLDAQNRVIAGNKTVQAAVEVGIEDVQIVESDGSKLIAVKRTDLDLERDGKARRLAYADNRVGEIDLSFSPEQIAADLASGVDLSGLWFDWELDNLKAGAGEAVDPNAEWQGMPGFENEDAFGAIATVKVHFASEEAIGEFARLVGQTVTKESKFIWYPKQQRENLKQYIAKDES